MTKWLVVSAVMASAWLVTRATLDAQSPTNAPKLVLVAAQHDFGHLDPRDSERTAEIVFRNTGSAPLQIRKVRTSCRCMTAAVTAATVPSAAEGRLQLKIDPRRVDETFTEEALIYSNDPANPLTKVRIVGDVATPVRFEPLGLPVGISYRGDLARIDFPPVRVMSADGTALGEARVTSSHPAITPTARKLDDGSYEVRIAVDKSIPLGNVNETVKVTTQHPRMPIVEIPVLGTIVGEFTPAGRALDFGFVPQGQPASATVVLPKRGPRDIKVTAAKANLPVPADVVARIIPDGSKVEITVKLASPVALTRLTGDVEVHTDNPDEPVFKVAVFGGVFATPPYQPNPDDPRFMALVKDALRRNDAIEPDRFFNDILAGVKDRRAIAVLMRAIDEGDLPVRMRAVELLGGFKSPEVLARLRATITEDSEEFVRGNALVAYAEAVGRAAVPELLLALQDDQAWVREDAATYLGKFGDASVIPALRAALSDPDADAGAAVRSALASVQARSK